MATDQNTPQVSQDEETLAVCEVTSAALEKAAQDYQAKVAKARACAARIPVVVESLVAATLIEPTDKEAAAREMTDPLQVLEMLKLAADSFAGKQHAQVLPATEVDATGAVKQASANGLNGWNRRAEFEKERDAQFDRDMAVR